MQQPNKRQRQEPWSTSSLIIRTGSKTRTTTEITENPYARQMQAPQTSGAARVASLQRGQ